MFRRQSSNFSFKFTVNFKFLQAVLPSVSTGNTYDCTAENVNELSPDFTLPYTCDVKITHMQTCIVKQLPIYTQQGTIIWQRNARLFFSLPKKVENISRSYFRFHRFSYKLCKSCFNSFSKIFSDVLILRPIFLQLYTAPIKMLRKRGYKKHYHLMMSKYGIYANYSKYN